MSSRRSWGVAAGTLLLSWGAAWATVYERPVGATFPTAPTHVPGRAPTLPADPLGAAIDARGQGDLAGSAWLYEQWIAQKKGSAGVRAAAQLSLGLVYLDLGEHNRASALFSAVRASGTAVAPWGAWYEAYADHQRGRHAVAARECAAYRKNWPEGAHADECLVLMGDANVAAGQRGPAIAAYQTYLERHPDSPREETLRLGIALAVSTSDPTQGIAQLQSLVLDHSYHSTGDTAQRRLDELAAEGYAAALPNDGITACRRAAERKRCGYEVEAWSQFTALEQRAVDDPAVAEWIERHADQFRWGTKQYDSVAALLAEKYAKKPTAELAWQRYRSLARGGNWAGAAAQLADGKKAHPNSRFGSAREELARAQLLAGDYAGARDSFGALAKGGGAFGKEARWLAAFAAYRLGDDADALARLEPITKGDDWTAEAARYYRYRTLERLQRADEAKAAREEILKSDPWSWYAALIRTEQAPAAGELSRLGRWPGPVPTALPTFAAAGTARPAVASPAGGGKSAAGVAGNPVLARDTVISVLSAPETRAWKRRPDAYRPNFLFNPAEGATLLERLGRDHPAVFPHAQAAADLARAGAFDLAAPLVAKMYDAIDPAVGGTSHPEVSLSVAEWRQVFMLVRDHYHTARFSWGTQKLATSDEQKVAAWRFTYPTAHADALWRHGEAYGVDPFLALGIMRQESVYRQWALSPVGAIGLMQVMPRTGARVAARMGDKSYSPDILQDPATNVRYGVWYLGQILDRFGGAYPLAVASYNGGPHNVSSWLRPWGDKIRVDDFVEQIPYPETRDYVKKVTGYYVAYSALYGEPGDVVRVPMVVTKDDPTTVDF